MTTEEGNKLIAEFITDEPEVLKHDLQKAGTVESMHYHDSWDWLMPVVRKAHKMRTLETYKLNDEFDRIHSMLFSADIKLVWDQIVEFIQWYNKQ